MLFDLSFSCYLTTFSGKKCQAGRLSVLFLSRYRSSPVIKTHSEEAIMVCTSKGGTLLSSPPKPSAVEAMKSVTPGSGLWGVLLPAVPSRGPVASNAGALEEGA
jgi:hypothetical protein